MSLSCQIENTLYGIPTAILRQSSFFASMLGNRDTGGQLEGTDDEHPVVLSGITAFEMNSLLRILEWRYVWLARSGQSRLDGSQTLTDIDASSTAASTYLLLSPWNNGPPHSTLLRCGTSTPLGPTASSKLRPNSGIRLFSIVSISPPSAKFMNGSSQLISNSAIERSP